jgi:hypothetical protein
MLAKGSGRLSNVGKRQHAFLYGHFVGVHSTLRYRLECSDRRRQTADAGSTCRNLQLHCETRRNRSPMSCEQGSCSPFEICAQLNRKRDRPSLNWVAHQHLGNFASKEHAYTMSTIAGKAKSFSRSVQGKILTGGKASAQSIIWFHRYCFCCWWCCIVYMYLGSYR